MSPAALFAAGWLAGVLTVVFLAIIGLRLSGERTDELSNQGADEGGRAFFQHPQPTTQWERNDHD